MPQPAGSGVIFYENVFVIFSLSDNIGLMNEEFYQIVSRICQEDPRYPVDAYEFVMEALSFAQKKFQEAKHINGQEFSEGIKGLLIKKFGPMTIAVLDYWGIKKTQDFGNIVYNLKQYKIIAKDQQDRRRLKTMRF
ncbi:MAG: hypothetical protein HY209_02425 [Candidatus Omnitrophica bacterium]|nr:hypothetical protein [Candidatus Omnitrophota bacterium]